MLIFTGQHPGLEPREFGLDPYQRIARGCPGREDPHAHARGRHHCTAAAVARRAAMSRPTFPFGDGRAAGRIAAAIDRWIEEKAAERRPARLFATSSLRYRRRTDGRGCDDR